MRIIELRSENFMRLVAVQIRPDANVVKVTGKNGAGKSAALESIHVALAGKAVVPAVPIRKGEEESTIRLTLGDQEAELIVKRTFRRSKEDGEYTTSLTVESPDGALFRSPQRMIDQLIGQLSFDPHAFSRMPPREQLETLRRFVPDVDFEAAEAANRADYEMRRELNREAKALRARFEALKIPGDPRRKRIDETALVAELEKAGEHNRDIERRKANRAEVQSEAERYDADAENCEQEAAALRKRADALEGRAKDSRKAAKAQRDKLAKAGPLPEPIETAGIRQQIEQAREVNREVDTRERMMESRKQLEAELADTDKRANALTETMEQRTAEITAKIAAAKLPVDGIEFAEDHVRYRGFPLSQASAAEQMRVSVAIAMALNPKLRILSVKDGSLLDEDSMRILEEMCADNDYQCWCEIVDSSGKLGFVIEDGMLKPQEEPAQAVTG